MKSLADKTSILEEIHFILWKYDSLDLNMFVCLLCTYDAWPPLSSRLDHLVSASLAARKYFPPCALRKYSVFATFRYPRQMHHAKTHIRIHRSNRGENRNNSCLPPGQRDKWSLKINWLSHGHSGTECGRGKPSTFPQRTNSSFI